MEWQTHLETTNRILLRDRKQEGLDPLDLFVTDYCNPIYTCHGTLTTRSGRVPGNPAVTCARVAFWRGAKRKFPELSRSNLAKHPSDQLQIVPLCSIPRVSPKLD